MASKKRRRGNEATALAFMKAQAKRRGYAFWTADYVELVALLDVVEADAVAKTADDRDRDVRQLIAGTLSTYSNPAEGYALTTEELRLIAGVLTRLAGDLRSLRTQAKRRGRVRLKPGR